MCVGNPGNRVTLAISPEPPLASNATLYDFNDGVNVTDSPSILSSVVKSPSVIVPQVLDLLPATPMQYGAYSPLVAVTEVTVLVMVVLSKECSLLYVFMGFIIRF